MKIVPIFSSRLFAFHYAGEAANEYDRILDLWDDIEYVYEFLKSNKNDIPYYYSIEEMSEQIAEDASRIDKLLIEITESADETLSYFFKPLRNQEYQVKMLSQQKGREHCLRVYAVKITDDIFVITGGAIKLPLHHLMEDREHTSIELKKLNQAKDFLKAQGVFDDASFFEFLKEQ